MDSVRQKDEQEETEKLQGPRGDRSLGGLRGVLGVTVCTSTDGRAYSHLKHILSRPSRSPHTGLAWTALPAISSFCPAPRRRSGGTRHGRVDLAGSERRRKHGRPEIVGRSAVASSR